MFNPFTVVCKCPGLALSSKTKKVRTQSKPEETSENTRRNNNHDRTKWTTTWQGQPGHAKKRKTQHEEQAFFFPHHLSHGKTRMKPCSSYHHVGWCNRCRPSSRQNSFCLLRANLRTFGLSAGASCSLSSNTTNCPASSAKK